MPQQNCLRSSWHATDTCPRIFCWRRAANNFAAIVNQTVGHYLLLWQHVACDHSRLRDRTFVVPNCTISTPEDPRLLTLPLSKSPLRLSRTGTLVPTCWGPLATPCQHRQHIATQTWASGLKPPGQHNFHEPAATFLDVHVLSRQITLLCWKMNGRRAHLRAVQVAAKVQGVDCDNVETSRMRDTFETKTSCLQYNSTTGSPSRICTQASTWLDVVGRNAELGDPVLRHQSAVGSSGRTRIPPGPDTGKTVS